MTELELTMARVAILGCVPVGYGMTRDEAHQYAKAAIEASEMARGVHGSQKRHTVSGSDAADDDDR